MAAEEPEDQLVEQPADAPLATCVREARRGDLHHPGPGRSAGEPAAAFATLIADQLRVVHVSRKRQRPRRPRFRQELEQPSADAREVAPAPDDRTAREDLDGRDDEVRGGPRSKPYPRRQRLPSWRRAP